MKAQEISKVLSTFVMLIVLIGIFSYFSLPNGAETLVGLAIGTISVTANFLLLYPMSKHLLSEKNRYFSVPIYGLRLLIYIASALICVNLGVATLLGMVATIIAISIAIFIVYGIGGLKENDQHR